MGNLPSLASQVWIPKSKFSVDDIPDLTGKVAIVTGSNTGVGKETAKALLIHNAKVYLAARSQEKAEHAIQELKQQTGKEGIWLKLDLGDLNSVKASAEEFFSKEKELHLLFNNAGVMLPPKEMLTAQGYDLQLGTNVLGHFYFTTLLLPALLAAARTSPDGKARVLNTSSIAAYAAGDIDFNLFRDTPARKKTLVSKLYAKSKAGNVLFSNELARRYGDQGIISIACNPGNLKTELLRYVDVFTSAFLYPFLYAPSYGALTQLWAGTMPEGLELNGQFTIPWARRAILPPGTDDPKLAADLWTWCEEQVANI